MLAGNYEPVIVAISLLMAMLASYTALDMAKRIASNQYQAARWWLLGGALAMGIGVWAMHFIGMLAFHLSITLGYDMALTGLSLLVAVAVSGFALWEVSQPQLSHMRLALAALVMGGGIAGMHYIGMAALLLQPGIVYDFWLCTLSVVVAVLASAAALWLAFRLRQDSAQHLARVVASVMMGLAIVGMHYIGMAAANFPRDSVCLANADGLSLNGLLPVVLLGALAVLMIALLTSMMDARLELRTAKLAQALARSLAQANEDLTQLALHDVLTKLPNRMLLEDRLDQALQKALSEHGHFALLFIDLDGFKTVNDELGHRIGNLLLIEVARRLSTLLRAQDTAARLDGDEFVMLIELRRPEDAAQVADKLVKLIAEPFVLESHLLEVSASVGVAVYPEDGVTRHDMLVNADAAMHHTKHSGRNGYRFFAASMNANAHNQLQLLHELRQALERNEFLLHYQPKFAAADGRVLGAEALVRWQHPTRGLVGPDEFIPLAEKSGLIVALGEWVLNQACLQMQCWLQRGHVDWKMAVNLSAVQFTHEDLLRVVREVLKRHALPAHCLTLEVTESTAMHDVDASMVTLQQIAALGVDISIDDFGTGYSSLLYLKRLPANELKIDRGFVRDLAPGSDDAAIVLAIVALGRALNLRIVAEGVETQAQQAFLKAAGCDALQGFLLGRPMLPAQFITAVESATRTAAAVPSSGFVIALL